MVLRNLLDLSVSDPKIDIGMHPHFAHILHGPYFPLIERDEIIKETPIVLLLHGKKNTLRTVDFLYIHAVV